MPAPRFHPLIRLLVCLIGILLVQGAVVGVIASAVLTAASITKQPPQQQLTDFFHNNLILISVLCSPSMVLWLWFCRRVLDRRSFVSLGLRVRHSGRDMGLGLIGGAAAISLLFGVLWLTGQVAVDPGLWSPEAFSDKAIVTITKLSLLAIAFLILGFWEEISFRGYIFHNIAGWVGTTSAVILQAVLFSLVHLQNVLGNMPSVVKQTPTGASLTSRSELLTALPMITESFWEARWGMLNIFLIGIFFALCYLKTGSLWFPTGFHAAWNFFQGCIFSLPVSGINVDHLLAVRTSNNSSLTGGSFGAEGSVLLIAINVALIYFITRQPDHPQATLDLALMQPAGSKRPLSQMQIPNLSAPASVPITNAPIGDTPLEQPATGRYAAFKATMRQSLNNTEDDPLPSYGTIGPRPQTAPESQSGLSQAAPQVASTAPVTSEPVTATPENQQPVAPVVHTPSAPEVSEIPSAPPMPQATVPSSTPPVTTAQPPTTTPGEQQQPAPPVTTPPAPKPPATKPPAPKW